MGRNFYSEKDFAWSNPGGGDTIACSDGKDPMFCIFDEGMKTNLVNAYMKGFERGRTAGYKQLQQELRALLNVPSERSDDLPSVSGSTSTK